MACSECFNEAKQASLDQTVHVKGRIMLYHVLQMRCSNTLVDGETSEHVSDSTEPLNPPHQKHKTKAPATPIMHCTAEACCSCVHHALHRSAWVRFQSPTVLCWMQALGQPEP